MKKHFRILGFMLFVISCLFLLAAGCGQVTSNPDPSQKEWTVIFYAAGDNDLEEYILNNIIELQKAGSTNQVNIVAQTDWWHHDGTAGTLVTGESVGRWYIEKSDSLTSITSKLVESLPEINTGTAAAVKDFVLWAVQHYPAKHYMLVMSSHGGGWRNTPPLKARGLGQDYTSDDTKQLLITLPDLKTALADIKTTLGKNLDILACDACLNGMIEFAYQIKDSVDYLVASEEVVPGYGFPWDNIAVNLVANSGLSPRDLSINMVDLYYNLYYQQVNSTLSAIDLSKISALASEVKDLASLLNTPTYSLEFKNLINDNSSSGGYYLIQRYSDVTFRDLSDMAQKINLYMQNLTPEIIAKCTSIQSAVSTAVIASRYTSAARSSYPVYYSYGLSIYVPTAETSAYNTEYSNLDFASATGWGDFLQSLN